MKNSILRLDERGVSLQTPNKETVKLTWKQPRLSFFKGESEDTNVSAEQILHDWIKVYNNHLASYLNETPEDEPGFKFGDIGITDYGFERDDKGYCTTYLVVDGLLVRQLIIKRLTQGNAFSRNISLSLEGKEAQLKKFLKAIKGAMKKTLAPL